MKPLFKNITKYNAKNYEQFIKFHGEKFNFSYNLYTVVMSILLIYCIILNIKQKNIPLILLFIALLVLIFLWRMYFPMKRYQKTKKKYSKNRETSISFVFYNFYFSVEQKTFPYSRLYKVFETKDYFYLYIDNENAVLVSKSGFKMGTAEEFSEFIKKKCFFKYKKEI